MKFIYGRIEEYVFGEWRLMRRNDYKDSLITPEQYQKEFARNIPDKIRLRCPCVGFDGKECQALIDFTNGENIPFFSTKDGYKHSTGCLYGEGGKKRKVADDAVNKAIDFNSFLKLSSASDGVDEEEDNIKKDDCIQPDEVDFGNSSYGDIDHEDKNDNYDSNNFGNNYSDIGCLEPSKEKGGCYRPRIEKLSGFEKIAGLALGSAPNVGSNNNYLITDSTICSRTAEMFNNYMIEMKPGDPMLVVANGWKLLYSICSACREGRRTEDVIKCMEENKITSRKKCDYNGRTSYFFLNKYIANEFEHIYELRLDKLNYTQREKWFKKYRNAFNAIKDKISNEDGTDVKKTLPSFIMGVEYVKTRRAFIAGRERIIDVFSLYNAKNFIVFNEILQEIDDNNNGL